SQSESPHARATSRTKRVRQPRAGQSAAIVNGKPSASGPSPIRSEQLRAPLSLRRLGRRALRVEVGPCAPVAGARDGLGLNCGLARGGRGRVAWPIVAEPTVVPGPRT